MGLVTALAIGATVAGSAIAAGSQKKAANKAADVAQNTATQNNALAANIYGQNKDILSPYVQRGNVAGGMLQDFYGLSQPAQQTQAMPNAMSQFQPQQYGFEGMDGPMGGYRGGFETMGGDPAGQYAMSGGMGGGVMQAMGQPNAAPSSANAFKNYIANSDYAFQFGEGANRVNSGYAGAGTIQSGAAMKAMEDYRQNLQSGYRGQWEQGVANQQGVGLGAGSALAGVGQNYVSTVSNNNNNAGSAAANAALMRGQNNPLAAGLGAAGGAYVGLFGGKK